MKRVQFISAHPVFKILLPKYSEHHCCHLTHSQATCWV